MGGWKGGGLHETGDVSLKVPQLNGIGVMAKGGGGDRSFSGGEGGGESKGGDGGGGEGGGGLGHACPETSYLTAAVHA